MKEYLQISVRFLSPTYCGGEWPPSPVRLLQALIAACHYGISRDLWQDFQSVLSILQKPPNVIIACEPKEKELPELKRYFPTNQFELDDAIREIIELGFYPLGTHPSYLHLPPDSRIRQHFYESRDFRPRWLGAEGDRSVHYFWELPENLEKKKEIGEKISEVAKRIVALGWGTDMVIGEGKITTEAEISKLYGSRYILDPTGRAEKTMMAPSEGFLKEVEEVFDKKWIKYKGRINLRPTALRQYTYKFEGEVVGPVRQWVGFKLCDPDDRETMKAFSPHRWCEIVGWVRHAVAKAFEKMKTMEWIRQKVLGHPEQSEHLHFIPVPSLGSQFADGFIRRIMICWGPEIDLTREEIKILEDLDLVSESGKKEAHLRFENERWFERFTQKGRKWESVSPVILHGYDFRRGKFSFKKCQLLILQAFKNSGYDPQIINRFIFQKSSFVPNALHVSCYGVPNHLDKLPRYHISVEFEKSVLGPVVVGRGRFYGLGLFMSAG
ncbi:MAG: type I-U CRISPR-associated protein Csb2 [Candidatus Hadarchaeales archaeon]